MEVCHQLHNLGSFLTNYVYSNAFAAFSVFLHNPFEKCVRMVLQISFIKWGMLIVYHMNDNVLDPWMLPVSFLYKKEPG